MTKLHLFGCARRIHRFDAADIHTAEQWQSFFDDGIALLDHPDERMKGYALKQLQKAVCCENSQQLRQPDFIPADSKQRLLPILDAISRQQQQTDQCLLLFTFYVGMWNSLSEGQKDIMSAWLTATAQQGILSADAAAIAKIQAELFPKDDWDEAKPLLAPYFDDKNDLLRAAAAAAAAFGSLYRDGAKNLSPLCDVMQQVKQWEIERPGFAGPFVARLRLDGSPDEEIENSGVKLGDWILEIIEKRKSGEPAVPIYDYGIDFQAREILSNKPNAVWWLIESGAESIAAAAATEDAGPIDGMQASLEKLANSLDDAVCQTCSWHLAWHYRLLHPEGQRRNYVQQLDRGEVEIFLGFDQLKRCELPCGATIYPRELYLDDDLAWKWIAKLIPPEVMPEKENNEWPYQSPQIKPECACYVHGPYLIEFFGDSVHDRWKRIWIRWPRPSSYW